MTKRRITFFLTLALLAGVGALYFSRRNETEENASSDKIIRQNNDISETVDGQKEIRPTGQDMRKRRKLRQEAISNIMKTMAAGMNEKADKAELQKLLEESTISEEELMRISIRNNTIKPHVWTEAPAIYDSMIQEQDHDREWTSKVNDEITDVLVRQENRGTEMVAVNCYETLCLGVFSHQNEEALKRFKNEAERSALGGPRQAFVKNLDDGRVETKIYFARRGDDALLLEEMYDRLYEKITGESVDKIKI